MTILEFLYKSKCDVSMRDLEEELKTSKRTILSTLEFAQTLLPENLALDVTEKGVRLSNSCEQSIDAVLIDIAKQTTAHQILKHVFYHEDSNIKSVSEKLFISESALRSRIAHMNKVLRAFKCSISYYDVRLQGDETNIRYLYYAYFSEFQELFISSCADQLVYCSAIYEKMFELLKKHDYKVLNYSYQQVSRWLLIVRERMELGKFVFIKPSIAKQIRERASYRDFRAAYEAEINRHTNIIYVPESEIIWAYIVGFNTVVYTKDNDEWAFSRDEGGSGPDRKRLDEVLTMMMNRLNVRENERDRFRDIITSYFINLSLLTGISPIFQMGSGAIKKYVECNLERLYMAWVDCLAGLNDNPLVPIVYTHSVAAQLAMISSPFIFNQDRQAEMILYSFEGEAGFPAYLETMAKALIPKGVRSVFLYNEPITDDLVERYKPDIVVCNYQIQHKVTGCKTYMMSYIPQFQEWSTLRELIINTKYNCTWGEKA